MVRDLCIPEKYTDKEGNEKTAWNKIGVMFHKDDKRYVKLFTMPGVLIHAFERKDKDETQEA
jgi:hypothetical protein